MMGDDRRRAILIGLLLVGLALAAGWSWSQMRARRVRAERAAATLADCRRLAADIESLKDGPKVAASDGFGVEKLGQRIEQARSQARLGRGSLEGVYPQSSRRIGATPYRRKPISLTLRRLTLRQLVVFLHELTEPPGLHLRELRLSTPRSEGGEGKWDAEATVTYLLYEPA